jgi:hypothetical protein
MTFGILTAEASRRVDARPSASAAPDPASILDLSRGDRRRHLGPDPSVHLDWRVDLVHAVNADRDRPTGTSRRPDPIRGRVLGGTRRAPLVVPPGTVVRPDAWTVEGDPCPDHGPPVAPTPIAKDRDAGADARVALEALLR